jgi:hypothetical protein
MIQLEPVQGCQYSRALQANNPDGTPAAGQFTSATTLSASVWAGPYQAGLFVPAVGWFTNGGKQTGYDQGQVALSIAGNQTGVLDPSGEYFLDIYATTSGLQSCIIQARVKILPSPGNTPPAGLQGLVSLDTCLAACSRLRLTDLERDFVSTTILQAASDTVRKWCGQRDFTRTTYVEEQVAELNGQVALKQMPVNNVLRIRGYPQTVLNITASPSSFQQAWVSYSTTGDWYTNTLAFTGIILNSVANGVYRATPLLFSNAPQTAAPSVTYATVGALQAAISAVSGWTAFTEGAFGAYPTTDLSPPGGVTAQGAMDDDGAELRAYTEDLTCTRVDNAIGFLWVGRHRIASTLGGRWGPEYDVLDGSDDGPIGRVQVTYDAGFTVIPSEVQLATAELVKAIVERFRTDHMTIEESVAGAGSRMYKLAENLMGSLPRAVLYGLAKWRIARVR